MSKLQFPQDYKESRLERLGPWPGPVPYREGDQHYRGRTQELNRFLRIVDREPLVLITGYSGTGKTSFLRAALIPRLRIERTQAILDDGDKTVRPAILVARDWITAEQEGQRGYDEILKDAIIRSIEALQSEVLPVYQGEQYKATWEIIQRDFEDMSRVDKTGTAYHYVTGLAEAVGSLLLCMDQFEEVLQGSVEQRVGILDTIAQLVKQRKFNVKILLSFRQEFSFLFQRLDRQVGNLAQATVYLEEMPEAAVRVAVLESAESGGVNISEGALDKLFEWMQGMHREQSSAELVSILPDEVTSKKISGSTSVDLLRLQALLQELYQWASRETGSREPVTITDTTVDRLLEQEQSDNPGLTGPGLVQLALSLFVERRVLPLPIVEPSSATRKPARLSATTGLPRDLSSSDEERLLLRLQQRRIAARMAQFFSSLGLKVQQYEAHLVAAALRKEWDTLGLSAEAIEGFLASVGLRTGPTKLHQLGLSDAVIPKEAAIVSGRASARKRWTYSDAVYQLLEASRATLERLADFNILRPKMARQGIVYELVHDGFGPALSEWSEKERNDPLDTLGAVMTQRGESFHWKQLGGILEQICWRGCWIGPAANCKELLFDNIEWIDCDLRGTFFDQCHFKGGSFQHCDVHGIIFHNCTFTGAADAGKRFAFKDINTSGLNFFGGSLTDVDFIECNLRQMLWGFGAAEQKLRISNVTFRRCQPLYQWSIEPTALISDGPLHLYNCKLELCDLRHLPYEGGRGESRMDIQGCKFDYCLLDKTLARFIDQSKDNARSSKLRDLSL